MTLNMDQVQQLSPDSASLAAGKKLASARNWTELGLADEALWGKCQGSAVYQVKFDRTDNGYHCSCPSRKFPCKHVLGLLLLVAQDAAAAPASEIPPWVMEWLDKRRARTEKKEAKQQAAADTAASAAADPAVAAKADAAQQRRAAQRDQRVNEGLERFDRWLHDLIRNGLADVETQPQSFWTDQAKRLVDAQAGGLASRVSQWADIPRRRNDWHEHLLAELGRTHLLIRAFRRLDQLDPEVGEDLKQIIGWNVTQERLESTGSSIEDQWVVIGQVQEDEDRLNVQRSWFLGRKSQRMAMVLQFAAGNGSFPESIVVGTQQTATLLFYPGRAQQRAKLAARAGAIESVNQRLPGHTSIHAWQLSLAQQLGHSPWLKKFGVLLHNVRLAREPNNATRRWWLIDRDQQRLPLKRLPWNLAAFTGGAEFDLAGEWDGQQLLPLSVWIDGQLRVLS